jgi:hypothetical protein
LPEFCFPDWRFWRDVSDLQYRYPDVIEPEERRVPCDIDFLNDRRIPRAQALEYDLCIIAEVAARFPIERHRLGRGVRIAGG